MFHWPLQEQTAHTHPLSPLNYVTVPQSLSSVDAAETPIRQSVTVSHLVTRVTRGGGGGTGFGVTLLILQSLSAPPLPFLLWSADTFSATELQASLCKQTHILAPAHLTAEESQSGLPNECSSRGNTLLTLPGRDNDPSGRGRTGSPASCLKERFFSLT